MCQPHRSSTVQAQPFKPQPFKMFGFADLFAPKTLGGFL